MVTIERLAPDSTRSNAAFWQVVVERAQRWAAARSVRLRDAIVLVPFAQLLGPARAAFAGSGGWLPRIETTGTLAASLGPGAMAQATQLSFDPVVDALTAEALLRGERWGAAWARRDPRDFDRAVQLLTTTATALGRAAFARPPEARATRLAAGRALLQAATGPGARERALARIALEWSALAAAPATEALFGLRPSGWIVVQAGGADPLIESLSDAATVPVLRLEADPAPGDLLGLRPDAGRLALGVCDDFEDEAQRTAAEVLAHVDAGRVPVALVAQDRLLVRRVRALLERHATLLRDETGWKLSTTRAAAEVMGLLRAAASGASTDALFDWLKSADPGSTAVDALEAACRKANTGRIAALAGLALDPLAARLRDAALAVLARLAGAESPAPAAADTRSLAGWLTRLNAALAASGGLDRLTADAAGRQVLVILRLEESLDAVPRVAAPAWVAAAGTPMDAAQFRSWVDRTLESTTFRPESDPDTAPEVIVVPLAGAMLRPFAAAVLPGADALQLGAMPAPTGLLSDTEARALGVSTTADRRAAEALAFAQLLAIPRVTLLRRRQDGAEPLGPSPLVEQLDAALAARGEGLAVASDPRVERILTAAPVARPAPPVAGRLPASLSASACEALRACPYQFFARHVLGVREVNELDREPEKREYGSWLHDVLNRFHHDRAARADGDGDPAADRDDDLARLLDAADAAQRSHGLADADFLPYSASFASFAPRYLDWLGAREATGTCWSRGEIRIDANFDALGDVALHGVLDRIDTRAEGGRPALALLDYKSGSHEGLKAKVREPFEDTQLAIYAALMRSQSDAPLSAAYLPVDGKKALDEVGHPDVAASADALVAGLGEDLRRMRAGIGLAALGNAAACEHCDARGVCRRDDWAPDLPDPPDR